MRIWTEDFVFLKAEFFFDSNFFKIFLDAIKDNLIAYEIPSQII